MGRLDGRVAIVTGAGSGIGRAIALGLGAEGAAVCVSDIDNARAEAVANEIEAAGGRAIANACDVSQTGQVDAMVEETAKRLGHIDILCNNAGRAIRGFVADLPDEAWDSVMAVNLRGTFLCSRAVLRHMIPQHSGVIVNTASGLGQRPSPGGAAYGASKAAIIHFTETLALEVARYGIRVNAFTPGVTDTPLWRAYRTQADIDEAFTKAQVGQPEDLVPTVVYLCSDAGREISGVTIRREVHVAKDVRP